MSLFSSINETENDLVEDMSTDHYGETVTSDVKKDIDVLKQTWPCNKLWPYLGTYYFFDLT